MVYEREEGVDRDIGGKRTNQIGIWTRRKNRRLSTSMRHSKTSATLYSDKDRTSGNVGVTERVIDRKLSIKHCKHPTYLSKKIS